jgi:predicted metalloprotease
MSRRVVTRSLLAVCSTLLVVSCSTSVTGRPVSVFEDPFSVAGMPAVDGPTGLRPGAREPSREVVDTDGSPIDSLAASSVSDIEDYWKGAYGPAFDGDFTPVKDVISWDADGSDSQEFCGRPTYGLVNAAYCFGDHTIGWDRGEMMPGLAKEFGDIAVTYVLAHEYGHAVQRQARLNKQGTPKLVAEQQADCFGAGYMRWVAEGNSDRFTLSTGDGLNSVLAAVISLRDPVFDQNVFVEGDDNRHGSAFDRVSAFQLGFTDGPSACKSIDEKEIEQRRGDLPVELEQDQTGEWPVSDESVKAFVDALGMLFSPTDPPKLRLDPNAADGCADARPSSPVSYCPGSNTISVDMPKLEQLGTVSGQDPNTGPVSGDNTAYSVLVSRYMLAVQHQRGLQLDNAEAALRTACLTGVATTKMSKPIKTANQNPVQLTAGDLDEAVSGLLTNGLAASDVNGESVPSGFSRIDAFRTGVLGNEDRCIKRFH